MGATKEASPAGMLSLPAACIKLSLNLDMARLVLRERPELSSRLLTRR